MRDQRLETVGVEITPAVAELLGNRLFAGPVGWLLGEPKRGPRAVALALALLLASEGGS